MNITLADFKRYRALSKEIVRLTKQLERLKKNNNKLVADKVRGSSEKFPYTERSIKLTGKTDNSKAIKRREDELASQRVSLLKLGAKLDGFIKTVSDREVRDTLIFYYMEGCKFCEISYYLGLEGDGSAQFKKVQRYFKKFQ